MIFLDSSMLIALYVEADERHSDAIGVMRQLKDETFAITNHNLEEIVTFIAARQGASAAYAVAEKILFKREVELIIVSKADIEASLVVLKSYAGFSLCDSMSVAVMKKMGISKIASFDSDFDKIRGITRIK